MVNGVWGEAASRGPTGSWAAPRGGLPAGEKGIFSILTVSHVCAQVCLVILKGNNRRITPKPEAGTHGDRRAILVWRFDVEPCQCPMGLNKTI